MAEAAASENGCKLQNVRCKLQNVWNGRTTVIACSLPCMHDTFLIDVGYL